MQNVLDWLFFFYIYMEKTKSLFIGILGLSFKLCLDFVFVMELLQYIGLTIITINDDYGKSYILNSTDSF